MKKLKFIFVLFLCSFIFFLIGGYFGFNNGLDLFSQKVNNCIESFNSEKSNLLNSNFKIFDNEIEIFVVNKSDCFSYNDLNIVYEVFYLGNSKELSFNLNNNLEPNENGVLSIELEKIQPFDSVKFKKFLFSSYDLSL